MTSSQFGSVVLLTLQILAAPVFSQSGGDFVRGNLIQFNDNGAWCWYQDERAVIDTARNRLIIGSVASKKGSGGPLRDGNFEVTFFDLNTAATERFVLKNGDSLFKADDHNTPAFLIRPDGTYLAMYTGHNHDFISRYRIYTPNGGWQAEQQFDWNAAFPEGANFKTTYSNLFQLDVEGRTYNFTRGNNRSPNFMISPDGGNSWQYGGQLTRNANVGYNNGYYRYCGNGRDRIDFIFTEYHPRDYNTSLFHGYIRNGKSYASNGTLADPDIFDNQSVPTPGDFTEILAANTVMNGKKLSRLWNIDLQSYPDGSISALYKARIDDSEPESNDPEHAFLFARYDGQKWTSTYLGRAGKKLYGSEQDYVGLGALHPANPNLIYLSTPIDPRDDAPHPSREIYRGTTEDNGATWHWEAITSGSQRDNLRPIIPAWEGSNTALLWFRGQYFSYTSYDAAVVGLIDRSDEKGETKSFLKASPGNTWLADGQYLVATGPAQTAGPADNRWHLRRGKARGATLFSAGENGPENAPLLKTVVNIAFPGTYDVWVNFWGMDGADWRIRAGLGKDDLRLFRQVFCQQVSGERSHPSPIFGEEKHHLYQAYLGRVEIRTTGQLSVFVDDDSEARPERTWYEGVSYAKVGPAIGAP